MRLFLILVVGLAMVILSYYLYKTYLKTHKLTIYVRRILQIGLLVLLSKFLMTVAGSLLVCQLSYCAYFIAASWLIYSLFRFTMEYVGLDYEKFVNKKLILILLSMDTLSLILNHFTEHLYVLKLSELSGVYKLEITPFYHLHVLFILLLAVLSIIALIHKSLTAPEFYHVKYILIAVVLLSIVFINMVSIKSTVDYTFLGFVLVGICIYHCVYEYDPSRLLLKTLHLLTQNMKLALVVLDTEGTPRYINKRAEEWMKEEPFLLEKDGISLWDWCNHQFVDNAASFSVSRKVYQGNKTVSLQINYHRMIDDKDRLQGGYYVIKDCTQESEKLERERYIATHDHLTGLFNKEYFFDQARRCIDQNPDKQYNIVCTDIKDFKLINDTFGKQAGDNVLMNMAKMIRAYVDEEIVYGRLGNDIFAFLIPRNDTGDAFFHRLTSDSFIEYVSFHTTFVLTNHIGVYEIRDRSLSISVMCDRARRAILLIKNDYHKKVAYYDDNLRASAVSEQELLGDLEEAITNKHIKMFLQPQVTCNRSIHGGEALVRWQHPRKGTVMPGEFIPIFEKNGLISEVDKYIWEEACKQLRKWKDIGREDMYISVNISPKDFYFLDVYPIFTGLVEKYEIRPQNLKLEITETALSINLERQLELINKLRGYGFSVEMDDFGSGYSSLNMLKDTNVDTLKLDMAFLRTSQDDKKGRKILQMVIELAKSLGLTVIAEGVETAEQVRFLTEQNCDMFQGYYFAKPMPVEEFEKKYMEVVG